MPGPPDADHVEALARWVDEDGRRSFLSVYVDLTDERHLDVLRRRRDRIRARP